MVTVQTAEASDYAAAVWESRKAKVFVIAGVGAVLAAAEVALYLCFHLSRTFYLSTAAVLAVTVVWLLLLLHCTAGQAERMAARRAQDDGEELRVEYSFFRKVAGLPCKFSYQALAAATDDFQCVVGRGASGTVFRGILDDGTQVAVKRIGADHADKEFKAEVSAIAGVQHVNLARLIGFYLGSPRFLVYEYMEHGSLDGWIFPCVDDGRERRCLPWARRYQVAVDVAKALTYLHHDCRAKVLHLDVKPENILLDDGFRGILSDFGLAKLAGKDQSRVVTTVRGTVGYLAPEWLLDAGITEKSDVYSYGMVLLEIVAGRRCLRTEEDGRWSYLPKIAAEIAQEGRVMELVDGRLATGGDDQVEEAAVRRVVHVALWCSQEHAGVRPSMARVVEMLEARGVGEVEAPPPSDTIMVDLLELDDDARGGGPFGLPVRPAGRAALSSSVLSKGDSFALSYLSGR
ncbi:probable receptor-like protein kinase At5g20050 [Lolium rigidum]|uniref:probable receptor-like protein kinase At5g20050 n=1 Tax=Lolium rigidum TaxID=89674 RepID=UPI001F5D20FF|nr:probable receptor-like protein kinase At5g20050 [Lolium rigidum]